MDKLRRFAAVLFVAVLVVSIIGCAQVHSVFDGMTGKPADQATKDGDILGWYHFGQALMPVIHALVAVLRTSFIPLLGL